MSTSRLSPRSDLLSTTAAVVGDGPAGVGWGVIEVDVAGGVGGVELLMHAL
jgi:hypothetical protein